MHFTEFIMYEATWKNKALFEDQKLQKPNRKPGNLLRGIVNWLGVALSVVHVC